MTTEVRPSIRSDVEEVRLLDVANIRPNTFNPNEMTNERFTELIEDMRNEGIAGITPILVRPVDSGFEIIDGEHRWRAAKNLGWKNIRCILQNVDEERAKEINYSKNRLRGNLNPFKEVTLFESAWKMLGTHEAVAKKYKVSRPYVTNTLSLRRIPEDIQRIVPRGTSRSILEIMTRINDSVAQKELVERIQMGYTVREAETFVKAKKAGVVWERPTTPKRTRSWLDRYMPPKYVAAFNTFHKNLKEKNLKGRPIEERVPYRDTREYIEKMRRAFFQACIEYIEETQGIGTVENRATSILLQTTR